MKIETYKKIVGALPFSGIIDLEQKKKDAWFETAEKAVKKLPVGNILIWANPGDGKTAMAILASFGFKRTLFATTAWELTMQHKDLYRKITGSEEGAFIMKNKITAEKRIWPKDAKITFSTTGILVNDLESGKIDLADYGLLVNDECDLALGNHVAARLARIAKAKKIPMLCLTATLGSKKTKETIMRNCGIYEIIKPDIPQNPRHEHRVNIEMTPVLNEIDNLFVELMQKDFDYLKTFVPKLKKQQGILCSHGEMEAIEAGIERCFGGKSLDDSINPEYFEAVSNLACYRKLRAAHRKCLVNSYEVFLEYAEQLRIGGDKKLALIEGKNYSKAANRIVNDERFKKIEELARNDLSNHPKFTQFEEYLANPHHRHLKKVVFVDEVATAHFLQRYFASKYDLKTAAYVGGQTRKAEKMVREELRHKINAGEFDVVFATSAMERGVDVKLDVVIHYTIAMERRAREQRSGRAGRFGEGHIYYFALSHQLDQIFFWATSPPESRQKKKKRKKYFFEGGPIQTEMEFPH